MDPQMIYIRRSNERGKTQNNWLNSFHTFSFGDYYDPGYMNFGSLRVINEDIVQPGKGFGRHPHNNMEIITYVIDGGLEHQDSMGTHSVIKPGEIQRMSAGTGIEHSEFNYSKTDPVHLLQIWIIPKKQNLTPSYEQKNIQQEKNKLILIASQDGKNGAVKIQQDVKLFVAYHTKDQDIEYEIKNKYGLWVQLVKGEINLNDNELSSGDGAGIFDEEKIAIRAKEDAEFLLFDLRLVE